VTCPYRGIAADTLGSKLESIASARTHAGVLVARQIEGGHYTLPSAPRCHVAHRARFHRRPAPLVDYLAAISNSVTESPKPDMKWCWRIRGGDPPSAYSFRGIF